MKEEYITQYLKIALNLLRFEDGEDVEEGFLQNFSPNYWDAIQEDMYQLEILDGTKDGCFLNSKGKLKRQIINLFEQLDNIRDKQFDRVFNWSQPCINSLLAGL